MTNNNQTTRNSWLTRATVLLLALAWLYVLSSGPMQLVRLPHEWTNFVFVEFESPSCGCYVNERWDYRITRLYAPLTWLKSNTPVAPILRAYWKMFDGFPRIGVPDFPA